jgi:hypothetical protein
MASYVWTSKFNGRIVGTCCAVQKQRFVIRSCAAVIACAPYSLKEILRIDFQRLKSRWNGAFRISVHNKRRSGLNPQDFAFFEGFELPEC